MSDIISNQPEASKSPADEIIDRLSLDKPGRGHLLDDGTFKPDTVHQEIWNKLSAIGTRMQVLRARDNGELAEEVGERAVKKMMEIFNKPEDRKTMEDAIRNYPTLEKYSSFFEKKEGEE